MSAQPTLSARSSNRRGGFGQISFEPNRSGRAAEGTGLAMATSPHAAVTAAIVAQLEDGPGAWCCPWHRDGGGLPRNALTSQTYRGINILSLWVAERRHHYASGRWASYRQWQTLGAQVRKGEKGTPVLFYKDLPRSDDGDADAPRFVARASTVFNIAQVEGAPDVEVQPTSDATGPTIDLDRFAVGTGAVIRDGESACYLPTLDEIQMPARHRFTSADGYGATLAHELVQWTGHPRRLDRQLTTRFGMQAYAAEELIAELGSAFVLAQLGLASTPHPNHASYIAHWLPLVRSDPRAFVTAAAHASRAADHLAALQAASEASPETTADDSIDSSRAAAS